MERRSRTAGFEPQSFRSALRVAHRLSDEVARLGAYALTNQSRAEAAAHEIVETFEYLCSERSNADEVDALAQNVVDRLMRLKRLLSTPATIRTVPEPVRATIFAEMAALDGTVSEFLRSRWPGPGTPPPTSRIRRPPRG